MKIKIKNIGTIGVLIGMLLLTACSETDADAILSEQDGIVDCCDLSLIEYPEVVAIYEVKPWQKPQDVLSETFLKGNITEETYMDVYLGWRTETNFGEYTEWVQSLGIEQKNGMTASQGIHYEIDKESDGTHYAAGDSGEENLTEAKCMEHFHRTMRFPDAARGQSETEKEIVEHYMEELGFPSYEMRDSVLLSSESAKQAHYMMCWQQIVDEIPVSAIQIPKDAQLSGRQVYNDGFNHDLEQFDGVLQVNVIDEEVAYWDMLVGPVEVIKEIESYKTVSLQTAYQKVANCYKNMEWEESPRLELAELQYKNVAKDGRQYLVPVWTFAVVETKSDFSDREQDTPNELWCYYLIDAVTGEFFTDINE